MKLGRRQRAHLSEEAPTAVASPDETATPADEGGATSRRRTLKATRSAPTEAPAPEGHPAPDLQPAPEEPRADAETPTEPTQEAPKSRKGRLRALLDEQVAQSREESERQAAVELRQFMEPARQQLLLNVPGSSSPEEAEAMLAGQAAIVLDTPVEVSPDTVVDLRNPSSMGAYPPADGLSNRVLRLADRHWAKDKRRSSADIVAEKSAVAEADFARKPAGTQRCLALRGSLRCRGVFAYHADDQAGDGTILACPTCGAPHTWNPDEGTWVMGPDVALGRGAKRSALSTGS